MLEPTQLSFLDSPALPIQEQALTNLTSQALWVKFKEEYQSANIYASSPLLVQFPQTEAITEMGRQQVRRFRTSHRLREDCDRISMLGKVAWSKYLGEPMHEVFDAWNDALGRGNKGIFFNFPGENIGLRTTTGNKLEFLYSRNKHETWITSMAFARVQMQHTGIAYVELLGWAHKNRITDFIKDRGSILQVSLKRIQTAGLLLTPEDLKERFADAWEVE